MAEPRLCHTCGCLFRPRNYASAFCSRKCYALAPRPPRSKGAYKMPFDFEYKDFRKRASLMTRAQSGNRPALQELWDRYHCRLPLVEARIGWRPAGG